MDWDKYERLLENSKTDMHQLVGYLYKYLPDNLFKYVNVESEYWKNLIYDGKVYLASPKEFNDPYDCLPKMDIYSIMKQPKVISRILNQYPQLTYNDISDALRCGKLTENSSRDSIREDIRIACFSERCDSMLMWSHYAKNHTGVCIGYNTKTMHMLKTNFMFPVIYSNKRVDITDDVINEYGTAGLRAIVYKAKEWEYEKEWRYYRINKDMETDGLRTISMGKHISSIYFGADCKQDIIKDILDWGKNRNIKFYQMKINNNYYRLENEILNNCL